jgi:5'(3')-deoxyribonucleotidase
VYTTSVLRRKEDLMLNGQPIVLLDVDDVICRCIAGMAKLASAKLGRTIEEHHVTTWDFHKSFGPEGEEIKDYIFEEMAREGWCLALEPFPGAVEGVQMLQSIAQVFFVTSPFKSRTWVHERETWLQNHFGIGRSHIVQTNAKFLVRGEVFVDDKPDNLKLWRDYNRPGEGEALLWDRPHNQEEHSFIRVRSWPEVYNRVHVEFYDP